MTRVKDHLEEQLEMTRKRQPVIKAALPWLITLTAGLVCYGLFFRRGLGLSVIGYSLSPAERVMQGEVPYRDFLFNYTPGSLWVNAWLMKWFGATMMTTRIGLFVVKLLTLMALFYVARRLTNGWAALIVVVLTLGWLGHQQVFNVYPDQYLILFALLGLACMLSYDERSKPRWLVYSGAAVGLVFLFKHNVGLLLFATGALAVVLREAMNADSLTRRAHRVRAITVRVIIYGLGFAVIAGALVIYLFANHALGAMVNHFLHHAAEYSEARAVGLPSLRLLQAGAIALLVAGAGGALMFRYAPKFFAHYLISILALGAFALLIPGRAYVLKDSAIAAVAYFPPLLFAVALALGVWQFRKQVQNGGASKIWWQRNGTLTIAGLFAAGVYLEVFPRADYHHLVRVLPVVFLFCLLFIARLLRGATAYFHHHLPTPAAASRLIAAIVFAFLLIAGLLDTWGPQLDWRFRPKAKTELTFARGRGIRVEKKQAELADGLVALINENSAPEDFIFSFSQRGSSLYFLSGRRNPTRLLWWSSVGIKPEDRQAVMAMVGDRRPKLIVIQDIPANDHLKAIIGATFHRIGLVADIAVYDRNP